MSLRYGVLGLLAGEPASGYDLARRFEEALGSIWPAKHPQIYGELARLAEEGMIEVEAEGPRRRKVYRVTEAGLADIRGWLVAGEVDHTVRLEPLLRSFFFWLVPPEDLQRHLSREAQFYRETALRYRASADAKDRGDYGDNPQTMSLRVAIEAGVRLYEALAGWAEWAIEVPPAAPADPDRAAGRPVQRPAD
jgi:DNA-binding PadR family transcriptional regulator